jgi:hypothetical protein
MTSPVQHCKECVDLLGEYIEGTLPPDRAKALEDHLSFCPPCITFVRTYRATRKLCRAALAAEMPRELMASLTTFLGKHVPGFTCSKSEFGCSKSDTAATAPAPTADGGPKKV